MTVRKLTSWIQEKLKEAEPLDRPSDMDDPRGVAEFAAKKLGLLCCGEGDLLRRVGKVKTPKDCAVILTDCLAVLGRKARQSNRPRNSKSEGMSVSEVDEILGVSKGAIYERCRDGRFPCDYVGRRIIITSEQLADYRAQSQRERQQSLVGLRHLS